MKSSPVQAFIRTLNCLIRSDLRDLGISVLDLAYTIHVSKIITSDFAYGDIYQFIT